MPARAQPRARIAAAFWLLVVAWLCANARPGTVSATLDWLAEASQFSHQQRLTVEIAELLGGEVPRRAMAKSEATPPPKPVTPPLVETSLKKFESYLPRAAVTVTAANRICLGNLADPSGHRGRQRAAPPHGPPRGTRVS